MKCITVTQPWACLVVLGAKGIETRSWPTSHRGPLLIHAGKDFSPTAKLLCAREPFRSALAHAGYEAWEQLPLGQVLGMVELIDCIRVEEIDWEQRSLPRQEQCFGDYRPGRWAWLFRDARAISPFPWRGNQRLFDVPMPS
jgi:hypothetical protein